MKQQLSYGDIPLWDIKLGVRVEANDRDAAFAQAEELAAELEGFDNLIFTEHARNVQVTVNPVWNFEDDDEGVW